MTHWKPHVSLNINSNDRDRGVIENFGYALSHQITFSQSAAKSYFMRLENIQLPYSFYQLNSNYNTFQVIETDGVTPHTLTITIDEGNYTILELITELEAALNTASSSSGDSNTYTITYDDITNKLTFLFTPGSSTSVTIDTISNGSTMNSLLGLGKVDVGDDTGKDTTLVLTASTSSVAPYSVDLLVINYIDIETSVTSNNHYNKGGQINIGVRVPMTTDRNSIQYFSNHEGHMTKINNKGPLSSIGLRLKDPLGNQIDLNEVDYNCELTIYELTDSDRKASPSNTSSLIGGMNRGSIGPTFRAS